jgi:hypothetical protein
MELYMAAKCKINYLMFKIRGRLVKVDPDIYYKIRNPGHENPDRKYNSDISEMRLSDGYPILVRRTQTPGKYKYIALSRFVMSAKKGQIVDHIDGDPLDNRRSKLRIVTPRQNSLNRKLKAASGFLGVSIHGKNGKYYCVGRFFLPNDKSLSFSLPDSPKNRIIAALARDKFVLQQGEGDYAPLNFPFFKNEPFRSLLLAEDFNKYRKHKRKKQLTLTTND